MESELSLDQHFLVSVVQVGRMWRRTADAAAEEFGLTEATAVPLLYLSRMTDGPRQSALAEAIGIERPSVVWLLDQLSRLGLIERREDPADKRGRLVYLTERGRLVTLAVQERLEQHRRAFLGGISREDLEIGLRCLSMIKGSSMKP